MSPNITLYPTWESDLPDSQVRLTCKLSGFYPDSLTVSWTKDSQPLRTAPTQRKLQSTGTPKTFTLSSEIEPDMRDWQNGAIFMCTSHHQTTKYQKTISICKLILSTPPAVRLEIPSFQTVMTANSQITATCIVHSIIGASLRWLLDGNHPSASQVHEASNTTHINSSLTVSSSKWRQMKVLSCKAEHRCLHSTEKTVTISGPPVTRPQVTIRRSFPDFLKGDCAVLECEITELSSSDLYVTFQSNGVDISTKEFVHLGEGSGLLSIRKTFSVPRNYWNKDRRFTCKVSQGFSNSTTSSPTGNIFVDPSLKLLLAPREEPAAQMLSCTAWGFNPHVQWLSGSQKISSESNKSISMKADGVVVVTSQLQVSQTEWKTGKVFTCEVSDKYLNKNTREKVSVCSGHLKAPPLIHVETPSFQTVLTASSEVKASCTVCTVLEATVTWLMDGRREKSNSMRQYMNSTHIISELTFSPNQWESLKDVTCRVEHVCFPSTESTVSVARPPVTRPQVTIRRSFPDFLKGDCAVLECEITELSSSDLYVTFQSNGVDISTKEFVHLGEGSGLLSIRKTFSVPRNYWNKDRRFTCKVSQGFSNSTTSSPTGNIFVDPSLKLLLAPREEPAAQMLSCTAWGFNPHVQWLSGSQKISSESNKSISMKADGVVVVTSQLQVSQTEWKTGKVFTCEVSDKYLNKNTREKVSVCSGHLKAPPLIHVETPSFQTVLTASSEVKASCTVCTVLEATVTWLMDGRREKSNSMRQYMNSTHIISELTFSPNQWESLKDVTCRVEHVCFPSTESTVSVARPPVTRPQVTIRRSFPDFLKGDCAVLECEITELSSSDLYVTFQSNGVDISTKEFVHLGEGSGLLSIRKTFSVPRNYWNKDRRFTCKVSQGFSNSTTSSPTGNIFVDPSLKLLLAPREEPAAQMLSCTAWGFNPHVQWLSGSQKISSESNKSISMKADGVVVVTSQLQVSQTEWKTGKVFTCEVSDKYLNKNTREKVSVCSVTPPIFKIVGVHIQGPSLEQLQNKEHILTVTCLLVGPNLDNFIVTWKLDENIQSGDVHTDAPVQHSNGTQTMQSFFSVSAQDWHAFKQVSCEAKHICSNNSYKGYTIKSRELHPPTVRVTQLTLPELSTRDTVTLICLISGFYPPDIIFYWEKNGIKIPSSSPTNGPLWKDKDSITYLTSSRLNISYISEDESNYSCVVRHESSEKPYRSTIKDVFASVIPTQPSAMLLRGDNELVCLVSGFSPAPINISWFLDNSTELIDYNTSKAHKGPDGKFCIQSHLRLSPTDILPGAVHTCRVTHATVTLNINVTQRETLDDCSIFDFIVHKDLNQDIDVDSWYIACIFLVLFLISTVFSVCAILAKTK